LLTPEATLEALTYLMANPVEAFAVRYARDWPGANSLPKDLGTRVIRVRRPSYYFDGNNQGWPDVIELRLEMPAALEVDYGMELAQERIAQRVHEWERRAWQQSKRARSYEAFGTLNPQFAAGGHRRAATEAVKRLRAFNAQYERALRRWMQGDRTPLFPEGTWWMRVCHGVVCGPGP
jgi:hypothetical protein